METKLGDKVEVYDYELGLVIGTVVGYTHDEDEDPIVTFRDGTTVEIEKEYIQRIVE